MDNPFQIIIQQNAEILQRLQRLEESKTESPKVSNAEEIRFSIKDLSRYLDKSESTINRYKNNGLIKFYQAGRTVFFKKSEVDAAMSSLTPLKTKKAAK